jgi:hypothetical protein
MKINEMLVNNGEVALTTIDGLKNCAICNGKNLVTEWNLMAPCAHIVCSSCTPVGVSPRIMKCPQIMKCPVCLKNGRNYPIDKSNYDADGPTSQDLSSYPNIWTIPSGFSSTRIYYPNIIAQSKPQMKLSLPPLPLPTNSLDSTKESNDSGFKFTYAIDGDLGLARIIMSDPISQSTQPSPIDLVILLDVSGSMCNHFQVMCKMMTDLVDTLSDQDRFGLIVFSDSSSQPFALQPMTSNIKTVVKGLIRPDCHWGQSTNLQAGVRHAVDVIKDGQVSGRTLHFLLITDGQANLGYEGHTELQELLAINQVSVKMCTFGPHIVASILTGALGSKSGDYVHLPGPDQFQKLIEDIGVNRQQVIADQVQLTVGAVSYKLAQIRTREFVEYPFKVEETIKDAEVKETSKNAEVEETSKDAEVEETSKKPIDIKIHYIDQLNHSVEMQAQLDGSLVPIIIYVHRKQAILDLFGVLLKQIHLLASDYSLMPDCKKKLAQAQEIVKSTDYGHYSAEIAIMMKSMEDSVTLADQNFQLFRSNSNSSNHTTALFLSLSSSSSTPSGN